MTFFELSAVLDKDKNLTITKLQNQNQGENNCTEIVVSVPSAMTDGFQFFLEFLCPQNKRYVSKELESKGEQDEMKLFGCAVPSCVLQEEGFVLFQLVARNKADNTIVYKSNRTNKTSFFVHASVNADRQSFVVDDYFAGQNGLLSKETFLRETADDKLQDELDELSEEHAAHTSNRDNPHGVTKEQLGLGKVQNTSDSEKSVDFAVRARCDEQGNKIASAYVKQTDLPSSLPANGGNADTLDGKHANDFATKAQGEKAETAYQKPYDGIGTADLSASVQKSLNKADSAIQSLNGYATESFVETKVAGLVNSAPETLDTLNELATALGNDPNFATTVSNQIGKKVDKEDGKVLSSNDFTAEEKSKLAGVAVGANKGFTSFHVNETTSNPIRGTYFTLKGQNGVKLTKSTTDASTVLIESDTHAHTVADVQNLQETLDNYAKKNDATQEISAKTLSTVEDVDGRCALFERVVADAYYIGSGATDFVVNTTGTSSLQVMSQKAVTTAIDNLQAYLEEYVDSEVDFQVQSAIGEIDSLLDTVNGEVI